MLIHYYSSTRYKQEGDTHSAGSTGAEGSLIWAKCIPLSVLSTSVYKSARSGYCASSVGWVLVSANTVAASAVAAGSSWAAASANTGASFTSAKAGCASFVSTSAACSSLISGITTNS